MYHREFFAQALSLAQQVKGQTSPNPAVGCVIVKGNRIVGQGGTQSYGEAHAEIVALREAGAEARGATVYVTLEPCVWYEGKQTLACTEALIRAGVKQVFVGSIDPNPSVHGRGLKMLCEAGVKVEMVEDFHREILDLNQDFSKYIQTGLPYIVGKYAMTLDGQIATEIGDSRWVSSERSRQEVHRLRSLVDVVLVGIGTVLTDNPQLTVRLVESPRQPLRVVVDPRGETPAEAYVRSDGLPTLFVTFPGFGTKLVGEHVEVWEMENEGGIRFRRLFERLAREKHVSSVLVEGGGRVLYRCLQEDVLDKLLVFVGGKLVGGKGIAPFEGRGYSRLSEAPSLKRFYAESLENDVMIHAYLKLWDV